MRANPQSAVGLMRMGGDGPQVLSTFTSDYGVLLSELHKTKIHGTAHLTASIQVAAVRVCICTNCAKMGTADKRSTTVGAQAPIRKVPATTHYYIHLLSNRRGREDAGQVGKEDEEEQRVDRRRGLW